MSETRNNQRYTHAREHAHLHTTVELNPGDPRISARNDRSWSCARALVGNMYNAVAAGSRAMADSTGTLYVSDLPLHTDAGTHQDGEGSASIPVHERACGTLMLVW